MALKTEQINKLLDLVKSSCEDDLDCDGCYEKIAEFAELELSGADIPSALACVKKHLEQCPCCRDEYEALKLGLEAMRNV